MIRSAALLLSGNASISLTTLLRNLLVARLISVEDYGIAATFAISMAIVELASNFGLQQLIVQDRGGDDPGLQSGLHGFNALRGLGSGLLLYLLAGPLAAFLGVPEVAWAYELMALVPVLRGFQHFDVERFKRRMRYGPSITAVLVPAALSVAALWPLAQVFGDWRVMLYAVLAQSVLALVATHLVAERRFAMGLDRAVMGRAMRFGWPLLVNGALLFLVMHGEKLVVGRELGMATLGIFAMGFTLTLTPGLVLARSAQAFFLPQLSSLQDEGEAFDRMAATAMQASILSGLLVAAAVAVVGPPFVAIVLGEKFAALVPLLAWLGVLQAVRGFKGGPATVALARGHTANPMIANVPRVLAVGISWAMLVEGAGLLAVIQLAIAAEVAGFALSLALVRTRARVGLGPMVAPVAAAAVVLGAIAASAALGPRLAGPPGGLGWALGALGAALLLGASLAAMRELRGYVRARAPVLTDHAS